MHPSTTQFYKPDFFASYQCHGNTPFCLRNQDSYYMPDQGLAERRFVYLQEETLFDDIMQKPEGPFTIGEIGFGTGLSFLSTLKLWKDKKSLNPEKPLVFISIERTPFTPKDLRAVLEPWTWALSEEISELSERYKLLVPGLNILPFVKHKVFLILLIGSAEDILPHCQFHADHWMLDGFSPSKNPSAWTDLIFKEITRLSQNKASLASFSSAGIVRRSLTALGWSVDRPSGFAFKSHITRATCVKSPTYRRPYQHSFTIAGGGIAGKSIAYFRSLLGGHSTIFDINGPQASHSPHIYTTPRPHRMFDFRTIFNLQTHFFVGTLYRDLAQHYGLPLQSFHCEPFDLSNRTHRLFKALSQQELWQHMVIYHDADTYLTYPYAVESDGGRIVALLESLSPLSHTCTISLAESINLAQSPIEALACSWGAQLWGCDYIPSSIVRGEMHPKSTGWSVPTHERHAFNPLTPNPEGFVGFRSHRSDHLPQIQLHPLYTSLHHGSRGFSSGPWCGLLIALASLEIFQYSRPIHET